MLPGEVNLVSTPPGDYAVPRLSPDGARVAVQVRRPDDDNQIGVLDPARGSLALLPVPGHSTCVPLRYHFAWPSFTSLPDSKRRASRTKATGAQRS